MTFDNINSIFVDTKSVNSIFLNNNKVWPTDVVFQDNLVMYVDAAELDSYPGSGNTWLDLTDNNHNLSLGSGVSYSSDFGGVMEFQENSNGYARNTSMNLSTSDFTVISFVRKLGFKNDGRVITAYNNNWLLGHHDNTYGDYYAEGWINNITSPKSDRTWRMFTGTGNISSDEYKLYINDKLIVSNNLGSQGPNGWNINSQYSQYSSAQVGNLIVYNRVLTAEEITAIYNQFSSRFGIGATDTTSNGIYSGQLVLNLDASDTGSYPGTGTQWTDLSTNNYHAINVGATHNTNHFSFNQDYMYVKTLNYGSNSLNEFSVFGWIRSNFSSNGAFDENWAILCFDRSEVFTFAIHPNGKIYFAGRDGINDNFDITGNSTCNDGNWHYVGFTYSESNNKITFYLDGESDRIVNYNNLGSIGNSGLERFGIIGDGSEAATENGTRNGMYYEGDIGMIHMYGERVLTDAEVLNNYNNTKSKFGL